MDGVAFAAVAIADGHGVGEVETGYLNGQSWEIRVDA